jgi:hypothetical protein
MAQKASKIIGRKDETVPSGAVRVRFVTDTYERAKIPSGSRAFHTTRIDWLTTTLQAALRESATQENGFDLEITDPDSETVLIYVRYAPDVNRTIMNMSIETAHKVIESTVKSYGWQDWVKVKEDVAIFKSK